MRLIRSKGVGVYFCSQNPDDVPDVILGQLGNRIQHALRAYTPRDQKAVKTAAETFVPNPKLDVTRVISELAVGEALVSMLLDKGIPMPVERAYICPPRCRMGAITMDERNTVRSRSPVGGRYDTAINRESAYEILNKRAQSNTEDQSMASKSPAGAKQPPAAAEQPSAMHDFIFGTKRRQGALETAAKSVTRTMATGLGRQIVRGVLGGIFGGKSR